MLLYSLIFYILKNVYYNMRCFDFEKYVINYNDFYGGCGATEVKIEVVFYIV